MVQIPSGIKVGSHVKSLSWILQIIVFVFVNIASSAGFSADGATSDTISKPQVSSTELETRVRMLDSVVSHWSLHDRVGKRLNVKSYIVRTGALADPGWIQKANEIVANAKQEGFAKPEIILTLSSTIPDALILQKTLLMYNIPTVIIELPDEVQARYEARYKAREANGFTGQMWFDTKEGFKKLANPKKAIVDASKIIRNSIEKPNSKQIFYAGVKVGIGTVAMGAAMGGMVYFGNVSFEFATAVLLSRAFFTGTTSAFGSTITNLARTDLLNDFSFINGAREDLAHIGGLGLGISETQHGISSVAGAGEYFMTQDQLVANNFVQGYPSKLLSKAREERQSESAADFYNLFAFTAISTPVGLAASLGFTGPTIVDAGFTQITVLTATSIAAISAMYLGHKYQNQQFEKLARAKWSEVIRIDRALAEWRKAYSAKRTAAKKAYANYSEPYAREPLSCERLFGGR
jgi:hypothetical protein